MLNRIEAFVKEADGNGKPIADMSPRRSSVCFPLEIPFVCKQEQCAVTVTSDYCHSELLKTRHLDISVRKRVWKFTWITELQDHKWEGHRSQQSISETQVKQQ